MMITSLPSCDSFADVFASADETVKKRAAKFIRRSFLDMDATMIMFVAQQLMQLEGKVPLMVENIKRGFRNRIVECPGSLK